MKSGAYKKVEPPEDSETIADLYAGLVVEELKMLIRQGFLQQYQEHAVEEKIPRGRILFAESLALMSRGKKALVCEVDYFTEDSFENRFIKSTIKLLIKSNIEEQRRKQLEKLLPYLGAVGTIPLAKRSSWKGISQRSPHKASHRLLLLCELLNEQLLATPKDKTADSEKTVRLKKFPSEKKLWYLYEKFLLAYFQKHYGNTAPQSEALFWKNTTNDTTRGDGVRSEFAKILPGMLTDVVLHAENKVLVIDAKCYANPLHYNKETGRWTLHSDDLYQIYAYTGALKKKDPRKKVKGILLYGILPTYDEKGNLKESSIVNGTFELVEEYPLEVKSLDLGHTSFSDIKTELDTIASWLSETKKVPES